MKKLAATISDIKVNGKTFTLDKAFKDVGDAAAYAQHKNSVIRERDVSGPDAKFRFGVFVLANPVKWSRNPAKKKKRKKVSNKTEIDLVGAKKAKHSFYLIGTMNKGKRFYFVKKKTFSLNKNCANKIASVLKAQRMGKHFANIYDRPMFVEGPLF